MMVEDDLGFDVPQEVSKEGRLGVDDGDQAVLV